VDGDAVRLAQLFANLLTNAAKYTPAGGHIRVEARADGGEIVARVTDDGVGIPDELLPRIFDLFVQGRRTPDRAEGGLGLGLALVKSFAMLHGGSVSARSGGGKPGSEFTVRLPLCATEVAAPAPPRPQPAHVARRVLVVDDNRDGADMLAEALRLEGHEVTVAYDGPEALTRLRERPCDVGILDLGLPIMDGYELAQRIREQQGSTATALIAITGYGQDSDRSRTTAAGFDLHLVKPVELQTVLRAVDSIRRET
jgi:CheY-like chemotaxis protein